MYWKIYTYFYVNSQKNYIDCRESEINEFLIPGNMVINLNCFSQRKQLRLVLCICISTSYMNSAYSCSKHFF